MSKWKTEYDKKLKICLKEAKKSNIGLMLENKKIITYSFWLEEDGTIYSESFTGYDKSPVKYPCQVWYKRMVEENIIPFKSFEKTRKFTEEVKNEETKRRIFEE